MENTLLSSVGGGAPTNVQGSPDALLGELRKQLLSSDAITSRTTPIEQTIQSAIAGVTKANEASNAKITSEADRNKGYISDSFNTNLTEGRAAGSGGLMNSAAVKQLYLDTDKQLKDLDQRKQELILAGDSAAASKIADLQIQSLDFRQKAQQQAFSNLLSIAGMEINVRQEQRAEKAQSFTERQAISNVALEYGLTVQPGDTIDTITTRAMPLASKQKKLELASIQSTINKNNAEAAKAMRGDASGTINSTTADILAQAFRQGDTSFLANLKGEENAALVYGAAIKQDKAQTEYFGSIVPKLASLGSDEAITKAIGNDPNIIVTKDRLPIMIAEVKTYASENKAKADKEKRQVETANIKKNLLLR